MTLQIRRPIGRLICKVALSHKLCKIDVSTYTISLIKEAVANEIIGWQGRPFNPVYLIDWLDGIVSKKAYRLHMLILIESFSLNCAFLFPNFARSVMKKNFL